MPTYQYFSRMVQILNVKLGGIFNESKHILVLGGSLHPDEPVIVQGPAGRIHVMPFKKFPADSHGDSRGWRSLSLNRETLQFEWSQINDFLMHDYDGPLYKVRLETNRTVRITKDHSLLVWTGTDVAEKLGSELKIGDVLMVPRHIPALPQENLTIDSFEVNENLAIILGYYAAEGSLAKKIRVKVVNGKTYSSPQSKIVFDFGPGDENCIAKLRKAVAAYGRKLSVIPRKDSRGIRCMFAHKELCVFLSEHVGCGAGNKQVPDFIYISSPSVQKMFLDCWLEGDAGVTISSKLANGILYLLPFLGDSGRMKISPPRTMFIKDHLAHAKLAYEIVPKTSFKSFCPQLVEFAEAYLEILRFSSGDGITGYLQQNLRSMTPRIFHYINSGRRLKRLWILQLLSGQPGLSNKQIAEQLGYCAEDNICFVMRQLRLEGLVIDRELSEKGTLLLKRITLLAKTMQENISFCKVTNIDVEPYRGPVCDFSIKGNETFVGGFGGVVCHNSGAGKTSTLLLLCYLMKQNGETILWRDDSSTEWLSMVNEFSWRCFVPQNCEFSYKHENIEYIPYDPWDLTTLFKEVKRGQAHAIEFDPYTMDISVFVGFWSRFFFDLYKWKGPDIRSRVAFFTDELNDLAAGARRGFVPKQLQLASTIYLSLKKYRKERIRLVACYDTRTRVLTQEGLKDYETLKIGDMGLSINLQTKEIEWKPIVNIHKYRYEGKMIHFKGKSFDVLVTPNHKMLLSTGQRTGWQNLHFEEASRASKRSIFRFARGTWTAQMFPDLTDNFFYLLGLYIGDGDTYSDLKESTRSGLRREEYLSVRDGLGRFCHHGSPATLSYYRPRVYLFIPPADRSRKKVEEALARLGIKWNNDHRKMIYFDTASSTRFVDIFAECGKYAENKHIPRKWLDGASVEQLKSLFEGLMDADRNNAGSYKTVSPQLAVDFVELVTKLGWSGTMKSLPARQVFIKDHICHTKGHYVISVHFRPKYKPFENVPHDEDYSGVVWCPEVADNHNLLIERNGRFVFCGNSSHGYGDLHKPVREGFNFYIFKRMDSGSIPEKFKRYDKVIERLDLNEMLIVDEERSFNKMEIEEFVKPKRISVRWKGSVVPISVKKADELAQWKSKIVALVEVLHNVYDVPYKMIAPALGYSEQSGLNNLMKKFRTKELTLQIETLSEQIRQLEKEQTAE